MTPHCYISKINKELCIWQCQYCGAKETIEELNKKECTHEYPPCKYCGQTPICSPDCQGIMDVLCDSKTYVTGCGDDEKKLFNETNANA